MAEQVQVAVVMHGRSHGRAVREHRRRGVGLAEAVLEQGALLVLLVQGWGLGLGLGRGQGAGLAMYPYHDIAGSRRAMAMPAVIRVVMAGPGKERVRRAEWRTQIWFQDQGQNQCKEAAQRR